MPRTKKAEEPTKRKSKKQVESDDDIENEIEDVKKSKKKVSKKKPVEASPAEDELSDLDAVEDEPQSEEEATTKMHNTRKVIDVRVPIGELGIEDILSHLIEMGHKGLNPQLKQGAIQLRNQLQSRRPYNQNFQQQRNFVPRGGRFMPRGGMAGRGGPRQPYQQQPFGRGQPFQPQDDQNIYDQTNE